AEFGQRAHDVAAEETRAAEDGDERFERNGGHARSSASIAEYRIGLTLYRAGVPPILQPQGCSVPNRPAAQVAGVVDALVSGTSARRRGGSSPLLGTRFAASPVRGPS